MKCPKCGVVNSDSAESCSHCGTPVTLLDGAETIEVINPTTLLAGSDFGPRYRIEVLLGQGGMGRVYKAYDKELDRTVAIKIIRPGLIGDAGIVRRFKQELLLASKISHKNVLRIHDMGSVGDTRFISMAFVEGQDLQQLLKQNQKLPIERALRFARQLAEALAAAHAEGVVHRDLKPQNILVDKDDHIYVSDFGLAKSFQEDAVAMTSAGAFLGTPRYMSPEQVEGQPADQRSDIYAYGLMLYEMVTGDVPFTGESGVKVMYQRTKEMPKSPKLANPALPDWLVRIIMHCLEKDPANRYQSANEILADLDAGRSPALSVARTVQINLRSIERRWWYASGAGILLLVGVFFANPRTRHWVFPAPGVATPAPGAAGLPSISPGKYVAVLPFRVLGDQSSLGYVADGLVEAMSAKLFQMRDVRLASSTAASKTDPKAPLSQVARELGVNLIVHGTVQGAGDNFRVTVNLENVAENRLVWSQEFAGVTGDLLTIEDHIYAQLVDALALKPSNEELARATSHPTENVEAYDLYLKGRTTMRGEQNPKNIQAAIGLFDQAVKKDSDFALAYAGLADASLSMYNATKNSFWSQKALGAAQQAERLNDKLPEVHFSLGDVYSASGQSAQAIVELKRALDLAPNSDDGYRRLGDGYLANGEGDKAIQALEKAIQINPYYWENHNSLGLIYARLGAYPKALEAFHRVTELEPDNIWGYQNTGASYFSQGKFEEAIPFMQKTLEIQPDAANYSNLGTAYFYLKRYKESVPMFEKAATMNPNDEALIGNLAEAYRVTGEKQQALATYDKAIALAYKELQVNPRKARTMADLAVYYAKKGNPAQAVDFIRRARRIDPTDVDLMYNAAIVYALANDSKDALEALRDAFQKGYSTEQAKNDPDLQSLRSLPEFEKLLSGFSNNNRQHQ